MCVAEVSCITEVSLHTHGFLTAALWMLLEMSINGSLIVCINRTSIGRAQKGQGRMTYSITGKSGE